MAAPPSSFVFQTVFSLSLHLNLTSPFLSLAYCFYFFFFITSSVSLFLSLKCLILPSTLQKPAMEMHLLIIWHNLFLYFEPQHFKIGCEYLKTPMN